MRRTLGSNGADDLVYWRTPPVASLACEANFEMLSPFHSLTQSAKIQHQFHLWHLSEGGLLMKADGETLPQRFPSFAEALRVARSISPGEIISLTVYSEDGVVKTTAVI